MASAGPLRLGTRGSVLALTQAGTVASALTEQTGLECVLVTIKTPDSSADLNDKSRFTGALEVALQENVVDVAIHSAKDLPGDLAEGLVIAAVPERAGVEDAWIGVGTSLDDVPEGASVGTASLRRASQLAALRPDLRIGELRGNVDTRLQKIAAGDFDAGVLALAGLQRLGRNGEIAFALGTDQMTPAPGQGSLALQIRGDDARAREAVETVGHQRSLYELGCERAAVSALDATCNTPVGVCARVSEETLVVSGYCGLPDGSEWIRDHLSGGVEIAESLGRQLAERMIAAGASEILERSKQVMASAEDAA